jgi:general stress protein YciG
MTTNIPNSEHPWRKFLPKRIKKDQKESWKGGFNYMTPERLKEVSSKGGKAPKSKPSGFATLSPEERSEMGRRGGTKSHKKKREAV